MGAVSVKNDGPIFDGYESVTEILDWVSVPDDVAQRAQRLTTAIKRSPGFKNFYQYIVNKGVHLHGYSGLIVRRANMYRWGSVPSIEFWENINSERGWLNATGKKRVQLVQQLEDTWEPEQKLIVSVLEGKFELPSKLIPIFSPGVIKL